MCTAPRSERSEVEFEKASSYGFAQAAAIEFGWLPVTGKKPLLHLCERLDRGFSEAAVIEAQRDVILGPRDDGSNDDDVLREIERDLDLEELQMEA